ncbi:MAG: glycosyltransferase family 2 protein, partial [Candidatus Uhrbacteria bacterium]|nr:glycosyltransferase family 2 protein [Candidatus Uhrbacteria bacterium]
MDIITAIIPAYNEAETIGRVIDVLRRSPFIGEVIVVSDGSTDATARIACDHGARVIALPVNMGKGFAVRYGVKQAATQYVALFDADLRGLRERHVRQLLSPVLRGRADMSVGITDRGPF